MHLQIRLTALCLIFTLQLNAKMFCFDAEFYSGYRWDHFEVKNTTLLNERPIHILEKFDNIGIIEIGTTVEIDGPCQLFLNFNGNYGWIQKGNFHLKKRFVDQLQELHLNVFDDELSGHTYELSANFGYTFNWIQKNVLFSPLIGYVYYYNVYRVPEGDWGPSEPTRIKIGPYNTELQNHSQGVSFGFDAAYFLFPCLRFFCNFRYEWLHYDSNNKNYLDYVQDDDTLIKRFNEGTMQANIQGPLFQIGGDYFQFYCFYFGALFEYRYLFSNNGCGNSTHTCILNKANTQIKKSVRDESLDVDHIRWATKKVYAYLGRYF